MLPKQIHWCFLLFFPSLCSRCASLSVCICVFVWAWLTSSLSWRPDHLPACVQSAHHLSQPTHQPLISSSPLQYINPGSSVNLRQIVVSIRAVVSRFWPLCNFVFMLFAFAHFDHVDLCLQDHYASVLLPTSPTCFPSLHAQLQPRSSIATSLTSCRLIPFPTISSKTRNIPAINLFFLTIITLSVFCLWVPPVIKTHHWRYCWFA